MSEQIQGNPQAGEGTPQNASQVEQPAGKAPEYLTREQALDLVRSELERAGQSFSDKTAAKVQKVIERAAAKGMAVTPQQAKTMLEITEIEERQAANDQAASQGKAPAQAQSQGQQPAPEYDPVTTKAINILKLEFGLQDFDPEKLDPADPDLAKLDLETEDPEKFFASVREYGKARKARATTGDAAAIPGLANGAPSRTNPHEGMRGSQILDSYYRTKTT